MHPKEFQMQLPKGIAYGNWDFLSPSLFNLRFEIDIRGNVDRQPGRYLQPYDACIAGIGCYFGLQTDVFKPDTAVKGTDSFSQGGRPRDLSDARFAPNGWIESAGYEDAISWGVPGLLDALVYRQIPLLSSGSWTMVEMVFGMSS